jgi:trimeric autotransporter adhesin
VFTRIGNGWYQQAYMKASNPGSNDQFGSALAVSADGNTLAVAAQFEDSAATGIDGNQSDNSMPESGAVYVFTRAGGRWSQQAYLKASNTGERDDGDTFGYAIALSDDGNTLAVGAPSEDSRPGGITADQADNSAEAAGAVYVFTRSGTRWSQQAYVKCGNPVGAEGDLCGYAVALSADGNTLAVGAFYEGGSSRVINGPEDGRLPGSGAAYVFTRSGTTWSRQAYLKSPAQDRADSMGTWITISDDGNTVVAGALDEDTLTPGINVVQSGHSGNVDAPDDLSAGAAWAFARSGTTWSEQANFKASNAGKTDWFGVRLAVSGDGGTLAVSAPNEDSAAQGINGNQDDNSADEAGAVYVYSRRGRTWAFQDYVKGSNTEKFDEFGSAVALSRDGRTMAVGARFEDSGAKGFNGRQNDNSVSDSGAVYIFVR